MTSGGVVVDCDSFISASPSQCKGETMMAAKSTKVSV